MSSPSTTVLAVAIEPARMSAGLVDRRGEVLVRDRISMPTRDVWRSLDRLVGRVRAAAGDADASIEAVGVSCAGPVDVHAGTVSPPHVPGWTSFPLAERIAETTGRPVVLESAGAAAAEAERWLGEARSTATYLSIVVDAVVDSACVIDGRRLVGAHGDAGSIAHIVVEPGGLQCWCGAKGCLDPYVSSIALEHELSRPLRRATEAIIERGGIMLGRAIASMAAIVDIETVFVTGSVLDAFQDPFLDAARREIGDRLKLSNVSRLRVIEPVEHLSTLLRAAALVVNGPRGVLGADR